MNDQEQKYLENLRHSCAHLLAAAIMELWPDAKRTIGPAIENGFYFDFDFGNVKISENDFSKIEAKMHQILPTWRSFERHELTKEKAKEEYPNNPYKHELIDEFSEGGEKISFYKSGNYWDLCAGGHCQHPNEELKHFKLLSIAGAYWRGSEKNQMLTRIYGTCFRTKEELDRYLWQLEEAKKRDHRKIGKELDLFTVEAEIGSGLPLFAPKGTIFRKAIEDYLTQIKKTNGYQFVWTPHIAKKDIYIRSQHFGKYDAMFNPMNIEKEEYVLKPMNCPHHFMIYLSKPRSYKDLPLRLAENATVYRNEKSGELNGLLRVRAATIDDTHTFVRGDSKYIEDELNKVIPLIKKVIEDFGFSSYRVRISIRDKNTPEKYIGDPKLWGVAEQALERVVKEQNIKSFIGEGEAAFYGPKIDFMINDAIGREWQCSTVQLDFQQPNNFDLKYIDDAGKEQQPAILHIAMIGSIERFMGILIEHYAGKFPVWLSPVQIIIIPIADRHVERAREVAKKLESEGVRVEIDDRAETMQAKIRDATLQKVPYMGIIGDKEILNISIRTREGNDLGIMTVSEFLQKVKNDIDKKV